MQNAGQYVPGAASAHPPQQFVPSEQSPNGGSTTSSLRQFRKRDVDKSQLEQPPKQESHVARVAPHNHYPPVSNDPYRYQHQFSDYSPQVKYSDIADPSQPNPISTSVIQKPKSKEFMEMCNVQQQHITNQQQYSPDNGQYMSREPSQGYPTGFKPETHYHPKDQHQYQQIAHHPSQQKFTTMMTQNMRKYNSGPPDNPFLNKLSKIHPSMARSIMSDHHLQEPQPSYSPMDQRAMYNQQNHRYYASTMHQPNPYAPNPNYSINPPHHYPNYASTSCSYPRTTTMGPVTPRYSHMERGISPTRRGYPENLHMNHLAYHSMPQKMPAAHNYSPQYGGSPEYAQHYQHRRMGQESYLQPSRVMQFMPNHHQMPAQEMQDLPESRTSPSDSIKKFIENWAADEEPSCEINAMEGNLRDTIKVRDDAPPGTVYMINATDVQYFENNGIPIVTSDNGGIQLTSENYQYLLKNGLVDNSGLVRIIEANKEVSIDSNGNQERVVNLQIMETTKSDCMMVSKSLRPSDSNIGPNNMVSKTEDETRRVVIHQNKVINPANCIANERLLPNQQTKDQASLQNTVVESISINKELVDKNCSPINLDQLENNLNFNDSDPPETKCDKNNFNFSSEIESNTNNGGTGSNIKSNEINSSEELSQSSDDNHNRSPSSKSMPIIDLFGETQIGEREKNESCNDDRTSIDINLEKQHETNNVASAENESKENDKTETEQTKTDCSVTETVKEKHIIKPALDPLPHDLATSVSAELGTKKERETAVLVNSVIVSSDTVTKDGVTKDDSKYLENSDDNKLSDECAMQEERNESKNTDEYVNTVLNKDNLIENKPISHTEKENSPTILETIDQQNQTTPVTATTEVLGNERRKRIFSVDDIIHHIGNNIKRGSRDCDLGRGAESLLAFIEKEVEFSSLEQILIINPLNSKIKPRLEDNKDSSLIHYNVDNTTKEEILGHVSNAEKINSQESFCKNKKIKIEVKSEVEVNDSKEVPNIKIKTEPVETSKVENGYSKDKCEDIEMQLAEHNVEPSFDFSLENDTILETKGDDNEPTDNIMKTDSENNALPVMESTELSNTPSDVQYRNIIRVEETSVLIQIAGEVMEISVNIVNGKKVINVVPLSDTTVVDFNDNYEVSANMSDPDTSQIIRNDPEIINSDNTSEVPKDIKENNFSEDKNSTEKCNFSEKQHKCSFPIVKDKEINKVHEEKPNFIKESTTISQQNHQEDVAQEGGVLFGNCLAEVQNRHSIGMEENQTFNINALTVSDPEMEQEKNVERDSIKKTIDAENFPDLSNVIKAGNVNLFSENTKTENSDKTVNTIELCESLETPKSVEVSEVVELTEIVDDFVVAEVVESVQNCEGAEIIADEPNTSLQPNRKNDDERTNDLFASNLNLTKANHEYEKSDSADDEAKKNSSDVMQDGSCPKTDNNDLKYLKCDKKLSEHDGSEQSCQEQDMKLRAEKTFVCTTKINEADYSDIGAEHLDYQLEDDVFISEEPAHEIIVPDHTEEVELSEEVNRTYDSLDIPLEQVTTTHEIEERQLQIFEEGNMIKQAINKPEEMINKTPNDTLNEVVQSLTEGSKKLGCVISDIRESPAFNAEKLDKELIVKIAKPEVQILSPTSTNIDDHVPLSNKNVYLDHRRTFSTDDESASITLTTKAAKKSYESDLQIPAVTTSGDVSTKSSKKTIKCQHDTVSSSEKEKVLKEPIKTKKTKRSKRLTEKIQIKNEQKEMLRLLAEKRKQRMESKQRKANQRKEAYKKEHNSDIQLNVDKHCETENTRDTKQKSFTENDDEYVDFKELLRARKLKKLKKMQEMKRREAKEIKGKTEVACPSKHTKSSSPKIDHLITANNNKHGKKAEEQNENFKDQSGVVKKDKEIAKKRKRSSISKSSEKAKGFKNDQPVKNELTNNVTVISLAEIKDAKNTTSLPNEIKPKDSVTISAKTESINNKLKIISNVTNKPNNINVSEASSKIEDSINKAKLTTSASNEVVKEEENNITKMIKPQKKTSFSDDVPSSTSNIASSTLVVSSDLVKLTLNVKKEPTMSTKDPRIRSKTYTGQVIVPSVSELIEENNGAVSKKKISLADYVNRKRKTFAESSIKSKTEEKGAFEKKVKLAVDTTEIIEYKEILPCNTLGETSGSQKSVGNLKTSFVIHSSDWEDSQSPKPATTQSNNECLINEFSGLIKNNSKRPVIDVNELTSLETVESPKDKKLQEYKDMIDSQLSSLNIQIPKLKSQSSENKSNKLICGSPESSSLVSKFLNDEKMTEREMEKIRKIISYKRRIQHQKNARSPSKSPGSTSSTYSQSPARLGSELLTGRSPVSSASAYSESSSDPSYEIKSNLRLDSQSRETKLHIKKVSSKRKLCLDNDDAGSSSVCSNYAESRHSKTVDYSVINRLGKDGLPKIIFKRNRQSNVSDDNQPVVELERIDNNLEKVEEKYNVTVTQVM